MTGLESPDFDFQSNLFALIRLIILKMVYRVGYKSLYAIECASLCSSSESMLKLSFVICTTLSTPGFLIIDSICLDRYLLIENVMQLGFEVNILTWGLEVFFFCFSVRVHYCLISCPSRSMLILSKLPNRTQKTGWKLL